VDEKIKFEIIDYAKPSRGKFYLGLLAGYCWGQLYQDWLGKEKYLKAADLLWSDTRWWWWGIAIVILTIAAGREE
jgi:hypothetical protein